MSLLLSEFYRHDDPEQMTTASLAAYVRVLAPFGSEIVRAACDEWRRSGKGHKPSSGNLHTIADGLAREERARREAERRPPEELDPWLDGRLDPIRLFAKRVEAGDLVADTDLWGRKAVRAVRAGLVTEAALDERRRQFRASLTQPDGRGRSGWREEERDRLIGQLEDRHRAAIRALDPSHAQEDQQ